MVDFGDGPIDVSRLYPDVHAAPPEHRAQMLRGMIKESEFGPNVALSVLEQNQLNKKTT